MIDRETQERLRIHTDGDAGPYLMVPLEQLPQIQELLRANAVPHLVDNDAIQLDGKAEIAIVNFGRGADVGKLQRLLDEN